MSTFRQFTAMEALYADRDAATTPGGIRGLKVADLEQVFQAGRVTKTKAGYVRKDGSPWDAHAYIDKFKTLASIDNVTDSTDKGLMLRLNFTDGSEQWFDHTSILIVEYPIV